MLKGKMCLKKIPHGETPMPWHRHSFPQCPGVWCLLLHDSWAPSHWRPQIWQKAGKNLGFPRGFLGETKRGILFIPVFLIGLNRFFTNQSGNVMEEFRFRVWVVLGEVKKWFRFLVAKTIKQAIHSKDSVIHQPLYKMSQGFGLHCSGYRWAFFTLWFGEWPGQFKKTLDRPFLCVPYWPWPFRGTLGGFEEGCGRSTKIKSFQNLGMNNLLAQF